MYFRSIFLNKYLVIRSLWVEFGVSRSASLEAEQERMVRVERSP